MYIDLACRFCMHQQMVDFCTLQLIGHWESKKLDMSELEDILGKDLSIICFPLSLIIREYVNFYLLC